MYLAKNKINPPLMPARMIKKVKAELQGENKIVFTLPENIPDPLIIHYKVMCVETGKKQKSWCCVIETGDKKLYQYEVEFDKDSKPNQDTIYYYLNEKYMTKKYSPSATKKDKE